MKSNRWLISRIELIYDRWFNTIVKLTIYARQFFATKQSFYTKRAKFKSNKSYKSVFSPVYICLLKFPWLATIITIFNKIRLSFPLDTQLVGQLDNVFAVLCFLFFFFFSFLFGVLFIFALCRAVGVSGSDSGQWTVDIGHWTELDRNGGQLWR